MFAWANQKLSELAEQIAPPANDAGHKFLAACSMGDESAAMACLDPMYATADCPVLIPNQVIGNAQKGMQAIHHAAAAGMIELTRSLVTNYGVSVDNFDFEGNTPLHHACKHSQASSRYLPFVKMLVNEMGASVVVQNSAGQTPYDAATGANVRNFLLPIQLQLETKKALETGVGLIPGQDLGGLRTMVLAPPPGIGVTPSYSAPVQVDALSALMQPPGMHTSPHAAIPPPPLMSPGNDSLNSAATVHVPVTKPSDQPLQEDKPLMNAVSPHSAPVSETEFGHTSHKAAPISGSNSSHARFNTSKPISGNFKYRPDGFHSSASDTSLQAKYGHHRVDYSGVPPPPTNAVAAGNASVMHNNSSSAAPISYSHYRNSVNAISRNRYLAYNASTGHAYSTATNGGIPTYANHAASLNPDSGCNPASINVFTPVANTNHSPHPVQQSFAHESRAVLAVPQATYQKTSDSTQTYTNTPPTYNNISVHEPNVAALHPPSAPTFSQPIVKISQATPSLLVSPQDKSREAPQSHDKSAGALHLFSSHGQLDRNCQNTATLNMASQNTTATAIQEHQIHASVDALHQELEGEFVELNLGEEGAFQ